MSDNEGTRPSAAVDAIDAGDHDTRSPRDVARDVIMRQIGADRCAAWCGVPRNTVYVWLKRGSDAEPIPLARAMTIFEAARSAGMHFDIRQIAPAIPAGRV